MSVSERRPEKRQQARVVLEASFGDAFEQRGKICLIQWAICNTSDVKRECTTRRIKGHRFSSRHFLQILELLYDANGTRDIIIESQRDVAQILMEDRFKRWMDGRCCLQAFVSKCDMQMHAQQM